MPSIDCRAHVTVSRSLRKRCLLRVLLCGVCVVLGCRASVQGDAALGGWGHFLQGWPTIHLANPEGEAFEVRLHLFRKQIAKWNREAYPVELTAPDGEVIITGPQRVEGNVIQLRVPAGEPGVYRLRPAVDEGDRVRPKPDFWLWTSLDHAVISAGEAKQHAIEGGWLVTQCSVPRRWWFWVPPGTSSFRVFTQRAHRYMSQREDPAVSVFSPRGQRMAVLVGQVPKVEQTRDRQPWNLTATVEVEPGAAGRFWSLEMAVGDAHHRSNLNLTLAGVPRHFARSPESWFDPDTGEPPDVPLYDDTPFVQAAYDPQDPERWPNLQHWSPCPALGDPDGNLLLGDARIALWNPAGRELRFQLADYLPPVGIDRSKREPRGQVTVRDASGTVLHETKLVVPHYHGKHAPAPKPLPGLGKGVRYLDIAGLPRWWAFTYPAVPSVLVGRDAGEGYHRFAMQVGSPRNYYFRVPRGCESFEVRFAAEHDTDVLDLEINAPDRTVRKAYAGSDAMTVKVPAGLDGKLWHLRPSVGSATRLITTGGEDNRYLGIQLRLDLRGVPPYLAPTREQWFNPREAGGS